MSGADGFELDPDLLVRASEQLDGVRSQLTEATSQLQTTVEGTGNPWGADAQGSAFAQVYTATLTHVLDVMVTHADQLDYAAQSLKLSAEDHVENDAAVRGVFESLGAGL